MGEVEILQGGQARVFVQVDGPGPANGFEYFGPMQVGDAEEPQGSSTPVYLPSSRQRNKWDIVDEVPSVPELGTLPFQQRMDRLLRSAWWDLKERGCRFHLQAVLGKCSNPSDFTQWESKILYSFAKMTSFGHGTLNPNEGGDNAAINESGELEFRRMIPIRPVRFSEKADAVIVAEVLDGLYNDVAQCGDCGPASDGCKKAYFLTLANGGSPGLSSQIVYTLDGFATVAALDIPTLGGLSGTRLAVVGSYLVVISEASASHHASTLDDIDAGIVNWAEVDSGYVAGKGPRAIYSQSALQTFVAAAGGYIYRLDDATTAVEVVTDGSVSTQDLNDIHGNGSVIVAVGGSNAVLVSTNDGEGFSLTVGPTPGVALNAVWVADSNTWFVGTADGRLFYTSNGGRTWTQTALGSGITAINDIRFVEDQNAANVIGYLALQTAAGARVYRTTDNGHSWQYRAPAIDKLPTAERINFVYPCGYNKVIAGGRVTSAGDGILAEAQ